MLVATNIVWSFRAMADRRKIGIRDVARVAGVSVATVSRVLADSGYPVAEATRTRVRDAASQLGFVPNLVARTFSTSRTDTIGVTVPVLNAYYAKMLSGIERRATENGLSLLLTVVDADHDRRERAIDKFLARQLDGMILCSGSMDTALDRGPAQLGVPAVVIGQQPERGYFTVTVDNRRASRDATTHLLQRGHRRILFLTSNSDWPDFRDRLDGFSTCLAEHGGSAQVIDGVYDEQDAYGVVNRLHREGMTATAIIAATDRQALGALAALSDNGVAIPGRVAVVGFDNYHTSQFIRPALTSVDMPADRMGEAAVDMIVSALAGRSIENRVLDHTLIVRQSS
jgi:DNA-binding LacI/PurR family transcriptional regulator